MADDARHPTTPSPAAGSGHDALIGLLQHADRIGSYADMADYLIEHWSELTTYLTAHEREDVRTHAIEVAARAMPGWIENPRTVGSHREQDVNDAALALTAGIVDALIDARILHAPAPATPGHTRDDSPGVATVHGAGTLSSAQLAEIRTAHVPFQDGGATFCYTDAVLWPCDAYRLLNSRPGDGAPARSHA